MSRFTVRPATAEDSGTVAALHLRSWRAGYTGIMSPATIAGLDLADWTRRTRQWYVEVPPGVQHLVAVDTTTATLAGITSIGAYRIDERSDVLDEAAGEVYGLYVDPPSWGRGAGRALMRAALSALWTAERWPVRIWVLRDNGRARRCYERWGFAVDGTTAAVAIAGTGKLLKVRYTRTDSPEAVDPGKRQE
ncbi:MAG: GNAT family N-acetyltransferase [Dactylosporangium sp.]|nr:GNAT family N-acetyltransferase [Dactylosporangium sp.]NNJ60856.1 GNAT family N-acetyltransferase [Dactylosporangium sp.]